jgi:hypothetical protein
LIDPGTGEATTWGRWGPADLNDNRAYSDGRGLNSAQLLAWLRAAAAFTGNASYSAFAEALKAEHGYGPNAVNAKITTPGDDNFSDDELLLLPLYTHLTLAGAASVDPELLCSLGRSWEQGVAATRSALWATIHAASEAAAAGNFGVGREEAAAAAALARTWVACGGASTRGPTTNGAVVGAPYRAAESSGRRAGLLSRDAATVGWSLRTWARDPAEWATQNAQRSDVAVARRPDRFGVAAEAQGVVLPVNERTFNKWNGDPFGLSNGALPGGGSESANGAYLLAYWMARFHGLLAAP